MAITIKQLPKAIFEDFMRWSMGFPDAEKVTYTMFKPMTDVSLYTGLLTDALDKIKASCDEGERIVDLANAESLSLYIAPGIPGGLFREAGVSGLGVNYDFVSWDPFMDFIYYASASAVSLQFTLTRAPSWATLGHELGHFEKYHNSPDEFDDDVKDTSESPRWINLEDKRNIQEIEHNLVDGDKFGKRYAYPGTEVGLSGSSVVTTRGARETILGIGHGEPEREAHSPVKQLSPKWSDFIAGVGMKVQLAKTAGVSVSAKSNASTSFTKSVKGGADALSSVQQGHKTKNTHW